MTLIFLSMLMGNECSKVGFFYGSLVHFWVIVSSEGFLYLAEFSCTYFIPKDIVTGDKFVALTAIKERTIVLLRGVR